MKQAYTRFRDKGFEIVSFTIDEERENWEQASVEEEIPWFDLGMGPKAEAALAYKVFGVPNNYLVESSTGEIIEKNLRQHKLDEKLEELLGLKLDAELPESPRGYAIRLNQTISTRCSGKKIQEVPVRLQNVNELRQSGIQEWPFTQY